MRRVMPVQRFRLLLLFELLNLGRPAEDAFAAEEEEACPDEPLVVDVPGGGT